MNEIRVKVADFAVAKGDVMIATIGLGSCVAIVLHDAEARVGGLAHVLLPDLTMSRENANPAKFPASAVPLLLAEMGKVGGRGRITARLVGGASMFSQLLRNGGVNMGERNVDASRRALEAARIPLIGQDVGGEHGRSVYLHAATGRLTVRSLRSGDVTL